MLAMANDEGAPPPDGTFPAFLHQIGDVVGEWWCPVCGRAAHRIFRPGRPRVYCSNACRQRAYRWRCQRRTAEPPSRTPPTRGRTFDRSHALRPSTDLTAGQHDVRGREVTMCGAFARRARTPPSTHTRFVTGLIWSCRTCTALGP
jgi:hypothetical protein